MIIKCRGERSVWRCLNTGEKWVHSVNEECSGQKNMLKCMGERDGRSRKIIFGSEASS